MSEEFDEGGSMKSSLRTNRSRLDNVPIVVDDGHDRNDNPSQSMRLSDQDDTSSGSNIDPLEPGDEADPDRANDSDADEEDEDSQVEEPGLEQPKSLKPKRKKGPRPIQRRKRTKPHERVADKDPLCDAEKLSITGSSVSTFDIKISYPFEPSLRSHMENLAQACNSSRSTAKGEDFFDDLIYFGCSNTQVPEYFRLHNRTQFLVAIRNGIVDDIEIEFSYENDECGKATHTTLRCLSKYRYFEHDP